MEHPKQFFASVETIEVTNSKEETWPIYHAARFDNISSKRRPARQKAVAGGGKMTNNAKRVRGFVVGVSCCPFSILVFFVRK
jgi:hypothetical protein